MHPSAVLKCQQKRRSCTAGRRTRWALFKVPLLSQQWLFRITHVSPAPTRARQAARQDKHWILHTQAGAPQFREHNRSAPMLLGNLSAPWASAKGRGAAGHRLHREELPNGTAPRGSTSAASSNGPCSAASTPTVWNSLHPIWKSLSIHFLFVY